MSPLSFLPYFGNRGLDEIIPLSIEMVTKDDWIFLTLGLIQLANKLNQYLKMKSKVACENELCE